VYKNYANTGTGNKSWVVGTFSSGQKVEAQVRVKDAVGNESAWGAAAWYQLKPQIQSLSCAGTNHYRQGTWNYLNNFGRPMQGYYSNPSFIYTGIYAYNENDIRAACTADSSISSTMQITGINIRVKRVNEYGNSVQNLYLGSSTTWNNWAGAPTVQNVALVGKVTRGQWSTFWLHASLRDALVNKTGGARSIGCYVYSDEYLGMANGFEEPDTGKLEIHSLG